MMRIRIIAVAVLMAALCSCGKEEIGNDVPSFARISFSRTDVNMTVGENFTPSLTYRNGSDMHAYDLVSNPENLTFSSTDPDVASVDAACRVVALKPGKTVVKAVSKGLSASFSVTVRSNDYVVPDYGKALTKEMVYGQFTINSNEGNVNPQSFDVDSNGDVWLEGAKRPYIYIQHCTDAGHVDPTAKSLVGYKGEPTMRVYYAGHGTCLNVEIAGDGTKYVWFANFGTKQLSGSDAGAYLQPRVLSRTKYLPGKTIYPEDAEENYYFGGDYVQMLPSIDFENRVVAIWVSSKKTVTMFSLDDVLNSPKKDMVISGMTWGGDSDRYPTEQTVTKTMTVHDCTGLKPLAQLKVDTATALSGHATQGFCVYGPEHYFFFLTNVSTNMDVRMAVMKENGSYIKTSTGVGYDDDLNLCISLGMTPKAYLEAEGVTIRKGRMFHCLAATWGSTRVATIVEIL